MHPVPITPIKYLWLPNRWKYAVWIPVVGMMIKYKPNSTDISKVNPYIGTLGSDPFERYIMMTSTYWYLPNILPPWALYYLEHSASIPFPFNSPFTQTTPEPTLLSWGGWPRYKIPPPATPGHTANRAYRATETLLFSSPLISGVSRK